MNLAARCERAERFSFIAQIIITQFYFYEAAIPLPQPLFPPPWQATTYLRHTNNELSMSPPNPPNIFLVPPRQPLTTSPGLACMPCRWWWWAVAWFQAPRAGKRCQSESLCFLITVVRSKPKLAICKVTFILLPTLFLCPWLTELSFLFVSLFIFNSLLCQLCLDPKMGWVKELLLFQTNLKANWIQVSA